MATKVNSLLIQWLNHSAEALYNKVAPSQRRATADRAPDVDRSESGGEAIFARPLEGVSRGMGIYCPCRQEQTIYPLA